MMNHAQMKLGRRAIKTDSRTLRIGDYLGKALPAAPVKVDWSKGIARFGMMVNDRLGDCTIAGCGHAIQIWTANASTEATVSDQVILQAYEAWDGYNPNDPSTDQGGIELDVLKCWKKRGLGGHKLLAFANARPANLAEVKAAINLFGGLYIGVSLPITAQQQDVWDLVSKTGDGEPGSWGGHCVYITGYDDQGFTCVTWGQLKKMTTAFWNTYVDEAHALLSPDWLGAKGTPNGFNLAQLVSDLALIK